MVVGDEGVRDAVAVGPSGGDWGGAEPWRGRPDGRALRYVKRRDSLPPSNNPLPVTVPGLLASRELVWLIPFRRAMDKLACARAATSRGESGR
jgi:hypothetical protein